MSKTFKNTLVSGLVVAFAFFGMAGSISALTVQEVLDLRDAGFSTSEITAMFGSTGSSTSTCDTYGLPGGMGIQKAVNQLGYTPALTVDGAIGPMSTAGIRYAQGMIGTGVDGVWGNDSNNKYLTYIAANCDDGPSGPGPSNNGELSGDAGAITVDSLSDYSNEEVGEGEDDVPVLAFEIDADDDSDVMIKSIKVELVQTTTTSSEDITDYASEVSIWFNGDKVGEADTDDFSENSDVYTKTISLDGVIIDAGDEEELVVAVSAQNNLDSGDIDADAFTVDVLRVRFVDGDGVVTTEDTSGAALVQSFDFTDFAESTDLELRLSLEDDDVNDANVIDIKPSDDTDMVELMSFNMEAEGDSDVFVEDMTVLFTSVGVDLDDALTTVYLYSDGEKLGSESVTTSGTTASIEFDEIDFNIDAGDEVEVIVKAKVQSIADGITNGNTIQASITATERALINAEDGSGEDVATGDMTGTAVADAHALYDDGIQVTWVDSSYNHTSSDTSGIDESVTFELIFDVTAFGEDIWVEQTCAVGATGTDIDAVEVAGENIAGNTVTCQAFESTGDEGTDGYEVLEGQTERFTATVLIVADVATATPKAVLSGIGYNLTDDAVGDSVYSFDLDDFDTGSPVTIFTR